MLSFAAWHSEGLQEALLSRVGSEPSSWSSLRSCECAAWVGYLDDLSNAWDLCGDLWRRIGNFDLWAGLVRYKIKTPTREVREMLFLDRSWRAESIRYVEFFQKIHQKPRKMTFCTPTNKFVRRVPGRPPRNNSSARNDSNCLYRSRWVEFAPIDTYRIDGILDRFFFWYVHGSTY